MCSRNINYEDMSLKNWIKIADAERQLNAIKNSEALTTTITKILKDKGFELTDNTYAEFFVLRDIVYLNVEVKYPEDYPLQEDKSNGQQTEKMFDNILALLKDLPELSTETWILHASLICEENVNEEWNPMKSADKYFICLPHIKTWFEFDMRPALQVSNSTKT